MTRATLAGWLSGLGWIFMCAFVFNGIAQASVPLAFAWVLVCAPLAPSVALMVHDSFSEDYK